MANEQFEDEQALIKAHYLSVTYVRGAIEALKEALEYTNDSGAGSALQILMALNDILSRDVTGDKRWKLKADIRAKETNSKASSEEEGKRYKSGEILAEGSEQ
jgi:hypothetical protein